MPHGPSTGFSRKLPRQHCLHKLFATFKASGGLNCSTLRVHRSNFRRPLFYFLGFAGHSWPSWPVEMPLDVIRRKPQCGVSSGEKAACLSERRHVPNVGYELINAIPPLRCHEFTRTDYPSVFFAKKFFSIHFGIPIEIGPTPLEHRPDDREPVPVGAPAKREGDRRLKSYGRAPWETPHLHAVRQLEHIVNISLGQCVFCRIVVGRVCA